LYINEIEEIEESEFVEFRLDLFRHLKLAMDEKLLDETYADVHELERYLECVYTAHLEIDPSLLDVSIMNALERLKNFSVNGNSGKAARDEMKIDLNVHVMETDQPEVTYSLGVPLHYTPSDVIAQVIRAKMSTLRQSSKEINDIVDAYKYSYMLNVCGCDEIFYGDKFKISAYKVSQLTFYFK
jgi:hypothetical protein